MACLDDFLTSNVRGAGDVLAPAEWPVIKLQQNVPKNPLTVVLADPALTTLTTDLAPVVPDQANARLIFKQHPADTQFVNIKGAWDNDQTFTFVVTTPSVKRAGIYTGDILILDTASPNDVVYAKRVYVEIEQNSTDAQNGQGIPSIAEIRLALRDQVPEANTLIEDVEFTDKEIMYCLRQPVDKWNNTPPDLIAFSYNDFPYRYFWIRAALGHLLQISARHRLRNDLDYSAGGISVADTKDWSDYERLGQSYLVEFDEWMTRKKAEINWAGAFGQTL